MEIQGSELKQDVNVTLLAFKSQINFLAGLSSERCVSFTNSFLEILENASNQNISNLSQSLNVFKYKKQETPNNLCGGLLSKGTMAFKCTDCMLEDNSIICLQCFNSGNHQGHNFQKIEVYGGCCDCGDQQKWEVQGFCKNHQPIDHKIVLNEEQMDIFIQQMQFLFYIILLGYYKFQSSTLVYKIASESLGKHLMLLLRQYNQKSLISNQITYNLLKKPYPQVYSDINAKNDNGIKIKNECIFDLLFKLHDLKDFANLAVDTLTLMFGSPGFKQDLTIRFSNIIVEHPLILDSDFMSITCQIFTSHKLLKKIAEDGNFPSLNLNKLPKNTTYEIVARLYYRYYIDLSYLTRLYNGANVVVLKNQFMKGKVNDLTGYQNLSLLNKETSMDYYGIQYIYFSYMFPIIIKIKDQKQLLIKMMKDLFEEIVNQANNFIYQSKERTFALCLFSYFDGNIEKAIDIEFLQKIGCNIDDYDKKMEKILLSSVYMMRTYALTLSNRQFGLRYYTYYTFSFLRVDFLVAMDLIFFNFCVMLHQKSENFTDKEEKTMTKTDLFRKIINKPIKDAIKLTKQQKWTTNHEEVYDRGKIIGVLTDYIGLFIEAQICDHQVATVKAMTKCLNKEQAFNFYGGLLISLKPTDIIEFKKICSSFLGDQLYHFEQFVQIRTDWENKKIKINQKYASQFKQFNFGYMTSKKLNRNLQKFMTDNLKQIKIKQKPKLHKINQAKNSILPYIFTNTIMQQILAVANCYVNIYNLDNAVMKTDYPMFSKFIEQLLYLFQITKNSELWQFIQRVSKIDAFVLICSPYLKKILQDTLQVEHLKTKQQKIQTEEQKRNKQQRQNRKKQKILKLKQKQQKFISDHNQLIQSKVQEQQKMQNENQDMSCILCKQSDRSELGILTFIQKSNLLMKKLLNSDRNAYIITTCNHCIHQKCYNQLYGSRQYAYCSICKNSCNLLLLLDGEQKQQKQQKIVNNSDEQQQNEDEVIDYQQMVVELILSNNPNQLLQIKKQKIKTKNKVYCLERFEIAIAMLDNISQISKIQEKQEEQKMQESIEQMTMVENIIEGLAIAILYGLEIDTNHFLKAQATPCHYLLKALKRQNIQIPQLIKTIQLELKKAQSDKKQFNICCFKFIIQNILELCGAQKVDCQSWSKSIFQTTLSEQYRNTISKLCQYISQKNSDYKNQIDFIKVQDFSIRKMPETLEVLAKEVGQCNQCHNVTNEISLCLLCQFRSCTSCSTYNLTEHTHKQHSGACIFIRVDSGIPIYIGGKKCALFESLYFNILRESYTGAKKDKSKFKLNIQQYQNIVKDIRTFRIQQKIRYKELITHKSFTKTL